MARQGQRPLSARLGEYPPAGRLIHQALFAKALPRLAVRRVRGAGTAGAEALATAIDGIRGAGISGSEAEWIERIESWRRRFSARAGSISVELSSGERRELTPRRLGSVSSVHRPWGVFLMRLVRELEPRSCVELGAAIGISAAYQGAALALNGRGRLRTVEGVPELAGMARETLEALGIERAEVVEGRFDDVLEDVLVEAAPVELAYIDAGKGREHNLRQFERLLPHLAPRAVLVMDDIHWSREMRSAWREIRSHQRVALSVDLWRLGACLVSPS